MNQEQQIYALMVIAEEQQRLITSRLEQQERSTNRLIQLEQQYMDKMQERQEQVQKQFEKQLVEMNRQLSQRIGTTKVFITAVFCFSMAFLACFGAYAYLDATKVDINASRAIQRELAAKKADVSRCEKDGQYHPCIRVMTSWGGYGDHKDYYIIDPLD